MRVICFHNSEEENGYLSNWYSSKFSYKDRQFSSMEQYMMYQKAICFHDEKTAFEILATDDVAVIKALGRQVADYDDHVWNGLRQMCTRLSISVGAHRLHCIITTVCRSILSTARCSATSSTISTIPRACF